jgi:hypothetical protein
MTPFLITFHHYTFHHYRIHIKLVVIKQQILTDGAENWRGRGR